jgi:hypothetical protein
MRRDDPVSRTWQPTSRCWTMRSASGRPRCDCIAGILRHYPWDGINRTHLVTFRPCAGQQVDRPCGTSTKSHMLSSRRSRCLGHSGKRIVRSTLDSRERYTLLAWRRYSRRPIRPSAHPPIRRPALRPPSAARSSLGARNLSGPPRFDGAMRSCSTVRSCSMSHTRRRSTGERRWQRSSGENWPLAKSRMPSSTPGGTSDRPADRPSARPTLHL